MPTVELPNEARTVENPILEWLESAALGWRYESAKAVAAEYRVRRPDGAVDEREVLLLPILRERLIGLNPGVIIDDDRADHVISRLRNVRDNAEWLRWLRGEESMRFATDEPTANIRLLDFENVGTPDDGNDYLATNQFRVEGPKDKIRTDIVLFINGIPLVNIEAKTTGRDWHVDWTEGAKQCGRYGRETPQLYYSNAFCVGVNERILRYGVPGAKFHTWQEWRDPTPHTHIPEHHRMERAVHGLLDRGNLLDIVRNFIVFEIEEGQPVKKVTRYQQFAAANEIVRRALDLDREPEWRRGLVWHTQGSGKSLTILFAAKKLWHDPALEQPTILVVIDRDQLRNQMIGQFIRTNTETCRVAESREDLMRLLSQGDGFRGIIVTSVHLFTRRDGFTVTRRNVIVLADEAHRTQEGEFGGWMRATLKEASFFGFTGTPIENGDHNTPLAFGRLTGKNEMGEETFERYMQPGGRYSIADAIRDGATVPILYEPRVGDWSVWGEKLDEVFEREFNHLPEGEQEQLKHENAKLEIILKLPKRVGMIATDVANDFTERVRPNHFKAMFVTYNKDTCALYHAALRELLGEGVALCIFSEDPERDSPEVQKHYLGDALRKKAIEEFKKEKPEEPAEQNKPENRFHNVEILIVCDMLTTGFDAPILETMYLDKGLRDHGLLQAIARVNRPYNALKKEGVILDYFGVFEKLQDALNFDKNELGEVAFPLTRLRERFKLEMQLQNELLQAFPKASSYSNLMAILAWFNVTEPAREKFELGYKNLSLLWETLHPDPDLLPFESDYLWLTRLWMYYRKEFYPGAAKFETDPADGAKTRELIRAHVDVEELNRNLPSYRLDADYLTKLEGRLPDAKALNIEAMLAAELVIHAGEDEEFQALSERLKRVVQQKRNGTLAGLALLAELEILTRETVALIQEAQRPMAESFARAAVERSPDLSPEVAAKVAAALVAKADTVLFPGWPEQDHIDTELFRAFATVLAKDFRDANLHTRDSDFIPRCITLLRKAGYKAKSDE